MAWEEFERAGIKGMTGDKPIDEIAIALKKIAVAYQERFQRKPTVSELLYVLEQVIGTEPANYVSDPEGLRLGEIIVNRSYEQIDTTLYEAVYTDRIQPGYHAILRRNTHQEIIKIFTLEVKERTLICEYEILIDDITDNGVEILVLSVLLYDFCDQYYENMADQIEFTNVISKKHWIVPYGTTELK